MKDTPETEENVVAEEAKPEEVTEVAEEVTETEQQTSQWPFVPTPLYGIVDTSSSELKDGTKAIVMTVFTAAGASFFWVNRDDARQLASDLKRIANS